MVRSFSPGRRATHARDDGAGCWAQAADRPRVANACSLRRPDAEGSIPTARPKAEATLVWTQATAQTNDRPTTQTYSTGNDCRQRPRSREVCHSQSGCRRETGPCLPRRPHRCSTLRPRETECYPLGDQTPTIHHSLTTVGRCSPGACQRTDRVGTPGGRTRWARGQPHGG